VRQLKIEFFTHKKKEFFQPKKEKSVRKHTQFLKEGEKTEARHKGRKEGGRRESSFVIVFIIDLLIFFPLFPLHFRMSLA
jgi:hypothetical protein